MAIPAAAVVELAKMGLSVFFQAAREAGMSAEEAKKLYESERTKFNQNTPDKLNKI